MQKLDILINILNKISLQEASKKVAALKYNYPIDEDQKSTDPIESAMEEELELLAEHLNLTIPTFLGSSGRNNSAKGTMNNNYFPDELPDDYPHNLDGSFGSYAFLTSTATGEAEDGTPIVLKLIRHGELNPYKALQNLKLSDETLNSVMPKIYAAKTFDEANISLPRLKRFYAGFVIMEVLHPLHEDIAAIFNSHAFQEPILSKLREEDIAQIVWKHLSSSYEIQKSIPRIFKEGSTEVLHKMITDFIYKNRSTKHYEDFSNNLYMLIFNYLKNNVNLKSKEDLTSDKIEMEASRIAEVLDLRLRMDLQKFGPMRWEAWPAAADGIKPIAKLKKVMQELLRIGIRPDDIHADNVMQRENGDIVISDPGHFMDMFGDIFEPNPDENQE